MMLDLTSRNLYNGVVHMLLTCEINVTVTIDKLQSSSTTFYLFMFQKRDGTLTCPKDGGNYDDGVHDCGRDQATASRAQYAVPRPHQDLQHTAPLHHLQNCHSDIEEKYILLHPCV